MYIPHAIDEQNITLVLDNKTHTIPSTALTFSAVRQALMDGKHENLADLIDTKKALETHSLGAVSCDGENVTYNGEVVNNSATKKLLNLLANGYSNIQPWLRFIDKLMNNPSHNSREQAYKFIEHRGMPLTEDGNVIGYKGVNNEYKDKYTGKFDNSVGAENWMMRSNVDDNVNNGCSQGFHVGSHEYADSWASSDGKLMLVEFSPKDIVSVPHDCAYSKLRVCRYKVIAECHDRKMLNDNGVYGNQTSQYGGSSTIIESTRTVHDMGGSFVNLQRKHPGITVNDVIDAFGQEDQQAPTFWFDEMSNELRFQMENPLHPDDEDYEDYETNDTENPANNYPSYN